MCLMSWLQPFNIHIFIQIDSMFLTALLLRRIPFFDLEREKFERMADYIFSRRYGGNPKGVYIVSANPDAAPDSTVESVLNYLNRKNLPS